MRFSALIAASAFVVPALGTPFVCGIPNALPCPDKPVGGKLHRPPLVRPIALREPFVCGIPNAAPCPDKPVGGKLHRPTLSASSPIILPTPTGEPINSDDLSLDDALLPRRIPCGFNGIECPSTPIGGPFKLGNLNPAGQHDNGTPIVPSTGKHGVAVPQPGEIDV
ncbi:hypothetical protein DL96DRAFT_1817573 [Flagelloscypha sp. PMI_526]|nr:hypothetical protein DL96DRAFT_1817573 [Flagelloscypha sp. PMI_526]